MYAGLIYIQIRSMEMIHSVLPLPTCFSSNIITKAVFILQYILRLSCPIMLTQFLNVCEHVLLLYSINQR